MHQNIVNFSSYLKIFPFRVALGEIKHLQRTQNSTLFDFTQLLN